MTRIYFLQAPYVLCYFPVNLKDKKERTALTFAAELGHPEVTSWLLKAEADVRVLGLQRLEAVSCPAVHPFVCVVVCSMRVRWSAFTADGKSLVHCCLVIGCILLMLSVFIFIFGYVFFRGGGCRTTSFWSCSHEHPANALLDINNTHSRYLIPSGDPPPMLGPPVPF